MDIEGILLTYFKITDLLLIFTSRHSNTRGIIELIDIFMVALFFFYFYLGSK